MNQEQHELNQLIEQTETQRKLSGQTYNKTYFRANFIPLLEIGQKYEQYASERIIKYYNLIEPNIHECNNNAYDIKINGITYEVKTDIKAIKTNNIFIEYVQKGKPSGISVTEANYYIIVIPYDENPLYLQIDVSQLKQLIDTSQYKTIFYPNKFNNFTGGYIFSVETIKNHSTSI